MKFVIIFVFTFYCIYHHAIANQQAPDDPSKPFWAARGRRTGYSSRPSIKADDTIPEKWADDDTLQELYEKEQLLARRREQATASLLATILNALSTWDGDVKNKRGDGKPQDPNNPFWAARG